MAGGGAIATASAAPAAVATAAGRGGGARVSWEFDNAANPGFDAPAFQPYDASATGQIEAAFQQFIVSGSPASWQGIVGGRWQVAVAFHEMRQVTASGQRTVRRVASGGGGGRAAPAVAPALVAQLPAPPVAIVVSATPPPTPAALGGRGIWQFDDSPAADGAGPFRPYDAASCALIEAVRVLQQPAL